MLGGERERRKQGCVIGWTGVSRRDRAAVTLAGHDSMGFLAASHRGTFGAHPVWSAHGVVEGQRAQRGHELQLPSQGRAEGRSGKSRHTIPLFLFTLKP